MENLRSQLLMGLRFPSAGHLPLTTRSVVSQGRRPEVNEWRTYQEQPTSWRSPTARSAGSCIALLGDILHSTLAPYQMLTSEGPYSHIHQLLKHLSFFTLQSTAIEVNGKLPTRVQKTHLEGIVL